jgi:hypothetical protein
MKEVKDLEAEISLYQKDVEKCLQNEMDANRASLMRSLKPIVLREPPSRWYAALGRNPTEQASVDMLEAELKKAFGTARDLISKMNVKVVFKGITYELLSDPNFLEVAHKALPSFKALHNEFWVAREKSSNVRIESGSIA